MAGNLYIYLFFPPHAHFCTEPVNRSLVLFKSCARFTIRSRYVKSEIREDMVCQGWGERTRVLHGALISNALNTFVIN